MMTEIKLLGYQPAHAARAVYSVTSLSHRAGEKIGGRLLVH